jgi:hypothetical protein
MAAERKRVVDDIVADFATDDLTDLNRPAEVEADVNAGFHGGIGDCSEAFAGFGPSRIIRRGSGG